MIPDLPHEEAGALLRRMLLMRRVEEQVIVIRETVPDAIRGHFHVYIGQEATGAAACAALGSADYVWTTHRNHGHVIARGGEPGPVLAEIIGRATGYNQGRAGTFHVAVPQLGILHTSAIVGGCMPLAAGAALSAQRRGTGQVSLCFFGDGVLEEGAFYEAINMSALWKLPALWLCENNDALPEQRAGGECPSTSLNVRQLVDVPRAFGIPSEIVDGADVAAVHRAVRDCVRRLREGDGPLFIEARHTRWPGNYGQFPRLAGGPTQIAWAWEPEAAPEVVRQWEKESDSVLLYARELLAGGLLSQTTLVEMDRQVREEAEAAARFAVESPTPDPAQVFEGIYA